MTLVYGVDFGTSNSSIVVGRPGGRIVRIRNPVESSYEVPSAVCLRPDGTMAVGSVATRMKLQRPAWYRAEFKRDIGDPVPYNFRSEERDDLPRDRSYHVYELVAEVLGLLRQRAEQEVPGRPDLVVMTVPASWEAGNRDLMLSAADQAGFARETVRLITEPEAAVAYAAQEHLNLRERTLLIYDLGGGTFDCALVRGRNRFDFEVLGEAGGIEGIGGTLFDRQILGLIRERYPERTRELLDGPTQDVQVLARRLQLRDTCENAKRILSSEERYEGLLIELGPGIDFVLTADELTGLLAPLVDETLDECERLLAGQGMDWNDIDGVVPVGGSVRLPMVGQMIARRSSHGRTSVQRVDDPELAVVQGAVLHAYDIVGRANTAGTPPPGRAERWPMAPSAEEAPPGEVAPASPATSVEEPAVPDHVPAPVDETYHAMDSAARRVLHGCRKAAALSATLAVLALIAHLAGLHWTFTYGKKAADGVPIAVLVLLGIAVISLALSAWAIHRMVTDTGIGVEMTVLSCLLFAASDVTYYLWSGWGVILVGVLLIFAWLMALGATAEMPFKDRFVVKVRIHRDGMSFYAEDGAVADLPWAGVEAFVLDGDGLSRALYARLYSEGTGSLATMFDKIEAATDETVHEYRLFDRFHFFSRDDVLDAVRTNSGGRLEGTW